MPVVATTFGRALGPTGKMPSPQLGIVANEDDNSIKATKNNTFKTPSFYSSSTATYKTLLCSACP